MGRALWREGGAGLESHKTKTAPIPDAGESQRGMERQHWALAAPAEEVALASPSSPPPSPSQTPPPPPPGIPSDLWTF